MENNFFQALRRFYDTVMQAVLRHIRFDGILYIITTNFSSQLQNTQFVILSTCTVIKCLIVASPGFVKVGIVTTHNEECVSFQDQFCEYLFAEAVKSDNKTLLENKPKFLLVSRSHQTIVAVVILPLWCCVCFQIHSSSGHKQSLKEVLADPAASVRLADTKVSTDTHTFLI